MIGEHDVAMARRDLNELLEMCKGLIGQSEGLVLEGARHNHGVDVPGRFAEAAQEFERKILQEIRCGTHMIVADECTGGSLCSSHR